MSPYRLAPSPAPVAPWRWTRARVADALGLWRWAWGRRWAGGRWAVYALFVPRSGYPSEWGPDFARLSAREGWRGGWDDYYRAREVRWRPVDACPHGAMVPPDDLTAWVWRACDCEVWP